MPVQTVSGLGMLYLGSRVEQMMKDAGADNGAGVWGFTLWWFMLVFTCATQDIAVDGLSFHSWLGFHWTDSAGRLGIDFIVAAQPLVCVDRPDRRAYWRRIFVLHGLPRLQLP